MSTIRSPFEPGASWRDLGTSRRWQQLEPQKRHRDHRSRAESWGSLLGGGALTAFGISRRSWPGIALAAAGGFFLYQGVTSRRSLRPIHVSVSFTINKPVDEVWNFWRNLENLARFMTHLEAVKPTSERYSYWTARSPLGGKISWHAEITDERAQEYLVWRSLPGSELENRGSVEFRSAPGDRGTEIHVALDYRPPAGHVGDTIAALFGGSAEQQVREDVRHFKQLIETGEIPTTVGQPHGRRSAVVKAAHRAGQEPEQRPTMPRSA